MQSYLCSETITSDRALIDNRERGGIMCKIGTYLDAVFVCGSLPMRL